MKRVTGSGGVFFKAKDAPAPQACTSGTSNRCPGLGAALSANVQGCLAGPGLPHRCRGLSSLGLYRILQRTA